MTAKSAHSFVVALVVASAALAMTFAQDPGTSSKQEVSLSGAYQLDQVNFGGASVSLKFSATISNNGGADVSGPIVLRHPNDISKVYNRFGDQSIAVGASVKISSNVTVPRQIYDGWVSGAGPALFFNTKNDRGDIKTYRISLSATQLPPAPSK